MSCTVLRCYLFLLLILISLFCHGATQDEYQGAHVCRQCHQQQFASWQGSHHDLAMQKAGEASVLGDFSGTTFTYNGVVSRFFSAQNRQGEKQFFVETDNGRGRLQTFPVSHTFGVYPLQQYLIPFPDGRYQALSIAWDSRPKSEGGQRWFHLYPDENIGHDDPLHWTGLQHNWNNRCADCHSTNLKKNHLPESGGYDTTWSEINVACEACHGPGKKHVELARSGALAGHAMKGFDLSLQSASAAAILSASAQGKSGALAGKDQIAVCGACHARRGLIGQSGTTGGDFHDNFRLALIEDGLYHTDGQIRDEVFELGSFMQSKMFHQGVTCSNCHDPHSLKLKQEGNALCAQCHNAATFDTPAHHHHNATSAGSQCVSCHMPATTYMVVDPRRDHSFRIPRPDLSERHGTPNACVQCHQDKDNPWAAAALNQWLAAMGKALVDRPVDQYAKLIDGVTTSARLRNFVSGDNPAILRASALIRLAGNTSDGAGIAQARLKDPDPLVRAAAVTVLSALPYERRVAQAVPLLADTARLVRFAALESLLGPELPGAQTRLSAEGQSQLTEVMKDYYTNLLRHRDSADGLMGLGLYHLSNSNSDRAEHYYRRAVDLEPYRVEATINLVDLFHLMGRNQEAVALLRQTLRHNGASGQLHHSLGLALVRTRDYSGALPALAEAARLAPHNTRYGYVHAVALNSLGKHREAIAEVQRLIQDQPANAELLMLGLDAAQHQQDWPVALAFARALQQLAPADPALKNLVRDLESWIGKM